MNGADGHMVGSPAGRIRTERVNAGPVEFHMVEVLTRVPRCHGYAI
jgi:hypothetical protein